MKRLIPILTTLLVVQLGLFAFLATREEPTATFHPTESLLSLDVDKVDKIVVEEKDKDPLTLSKQDGIWVLPEHFDFPVLKTKIQDFTKAMAEFKRSWPVGKTDIAAKQFSVVDEKFERRLTFYQGEQKLKTVYLGSSPSFRKVNIRVDGDQLTYSVPFNTYEVPTAAKDWVDKKYLTYERSNVKEVQVGDLVLQNKGGDFILPDLAENKETVTAKTGSLATKAFATDFEEVLGKKDAVPTAEKVLGFTLTEENGEKVEFNYFKTPAAEGEGLAENKEATPGQPALNGADKASKKADDYLVLTTSKHPYAFKVRKSRVEDLMAIKADELVKDKEVAEAKESKGEEEKKAETEPKEGAELTQPGADNSDRGALAEGGPEVAGEG